jgi:hypothetical protein
LGCILGDFFSQTHLVTLVISVALIALMLQHCCEKSMAEILLPSPTADQKP